MDSLYPYGRGSAVHSVRKKIPVTQFSRGRYDARVDSSPGILYVKLEQGSTSDQGKKKECIKA